MEKEHDDEKDTASTESPCEEGDHKCLDTTITRFIGDHPGACLAGAFAIGFLLARLTKGRG